MSRCCHHLLDNIPGRCRHDDIGTHMYFLCCKFLYKRKVNFPWWRGWHTLACPLKSIWDRSSTLVSKSSCLRRHLARRSLPKRAMSKFTRSVKWAVFVLSRSFDDERLWATSIFDFCGSFLSVCAAAHSSSSGSRNCKVALREMIGKWLLRRSHTFVSRTFQFVS